MSMITFQGKVSRTFSCSESKGEGVPQFRALRTGSSLTGFFFFSWDTFVNLQEKGSGRSEGSRWDVK